MDILQSELYHIYNQGNNKEKLFYSDCDYLHYLKLFRKNVFPYCQVIAYCLMPNHFHFLIHTTEASVKIKKAGHLQVSELSNGFRLLQSQYAQYINKEINRTGSLFRQKLKVKCMRDGDEHYGYTAFHYIHQNPIKAMLVKRLEEWRFSSFPDYAGLRNGTLCNQQLAAILIGFDKKNFVNESYQNLDDKQINKIVF